MIIYKITNKVNGKIYIGQTIQSLEKRWFDHCRKNSCCRLLRNAIQKYGRDNFTIQQIDHAHSRCELDNKEIFWIEFYDCMTPNGYNLLSGGLHHEISEETRKKMSEAQRGEKHPMYGTHHSEEHKRKIGDSVRGEKNGNYGKHLSEETRRKLSFGRKGEKHWNYGKRFSEERKNKMSENHFKRKEVVCLETGEVFHSISDAQKKYKIRRIGNVCRGEKDSSGGFHWKYYKRESN